MQVVKGGQLLVENTYHIPDDYYVYCLAGYLI